MKIMKKSGKIIDFNPSKIIISMENAADDIGVHITSSDIELLTKDILKTLYSLLRDENYSSSYEVRSVLVETLVKNGYQNIAKSYMMNMF